MDVKNVPKLGVWGILAFIVHIPERHVSNTMHYSAPLYLQGIIYLVQDKKCWMLSIGFDAVKHRGESYSHGILTIFTGIFIDNLYVSNIHFCALHVVKTYPTLLLNVLEQCLQAVGSKDLLVSRVVEQNRCLVTYLARLCNFSACYLTLCTDNAAEYASCMEWYTVHLIQHSNPQSEYHCWL